MELISRLLRNYLSLYNCVSLYVHEVRAPNLIIMFGKRSLFRVPKHQQFDYKPMYYDPQKEELEERLKSLRELQQEDIEGTKARIASGMRSTYQADQAYRKQQVLRSNLILVGVVIMLIILGYMLLNVYLPQLNQFME